MPPIDAKALAPRLATLQGKTVYVYGSDFVMSSGLEIMLMIARGLAQTVPGIKVVYHQRPVWRCHGRFGCSGASDRQGPGRYG